MSDQRNLILAIVLSVVIILGFQFFYEGPRMRDAQQRADAERQATTDTIRPAPAAQAPGTPAAAAPSAQAAEAAVPSPRVKLDNGRLHGSVSLKGGRIDDITLADYRETVDPASPEITLLAPPGRPNPYFAEFGWVPQQGAATQVPTSDTLWQEDGKVDPLSPQQPLSLRWDNGQGLLFGQQVAIDDNYMFSVKRTVTNSGSEPVTLYPYGLLSRWGTPPTMGYYILHEGPIGVFDGSLHEVKYKKLADSGTIAQTSKGGWLGFTDKYWLAALVPQQDQELETKFQHQAEGDRYQIDFRGPPLTVQPGQTVETTDRLFAGAKEVKLLDSYSERLGIPLFDRAVDFGWFYFLTKPIFLTLHFLHGVTGNYGIAILILTLCIKALFFPLANRSYAAMSKMKRLQPEMQKLRERYADDQPKMNQELMQLYKKEGANPVSGCLPIVIQIPVFFSLYKVIFTTIEMRHAPFFGWVHDLSAPDPTNLFTLFGAIPWTPPHMLTIGIWPLIMGFTMFLQQKLNPQPADPTQARVMMFLPVMFTFLFATFPAGLVIYWAWNNSLSVLQQWLIMKRMGVKAS